jgi:dolichol kinase
VDAPEAGLLDAVHELVDVSEAFGVHAPSQAEQRRLLAKAAAVRERVASLSERPGGTPAPQHAELLVRVDALVAQLGPGHDAASWRAARAPLADAYDDLRLSSGDRHGMGRRVRTRAKPHNLARTCFHMLSGVMWALLYEHVLDRGPLLWVLGGCLIFFVTDDAMRRWFPENRSGFAVVVFRVLARASEASRVASSTWYTLGLIVGVAFLPKPVCLMGLLILAFADPAAGFVGRRWGGPRLYRDKSMGGTAAFFVVAFGIATATLALELPALGLVSRLGVAAMIALAGTVAELFGDHVPDNFSILVVTGTVAALLF